MSRKQEVKQRSQKYTGLTLNKSMKKGKETYIQQNLASSQLFYITQGKLMQIIKNIVPRIWKLKPQNVLFSLHKSQLIGHSPSGHAISSRLDGSLVIITITVQQRLQFYLIIHLWSSCFNSASSAYEVTLLELFIFQSVINTDYAFYQNMYLLFTFNSEGPDLTTIWPLL